MCHLKDIFLKEKQNTVNLLSDGNTLESVKELIVNIEEFETEI